MSEKFKILIVEDELISANEIATSHDLVKSKMILLSDDWRKHFLKSIQKV
jgi:hypothetical protein